LELNEKVSDSTICATKNKPSKKIEATQENEDSSTPTSSDSVSTQLSQNPVDLQEVDSNDWKKSPEDDLKSLHNNEKTTTASYLPKKIETKYSVRRKRNPMFGPAKVQNACQCEETVKQQQNSHFSKKWKTSNQGAIVAHHSSYQRKGHKNTYSDGDSTLFKSFHIKKN